MDQLPLADHTQLYRAIGLELSQTMGGSSGVLLAIFFAAAGDAASSGLTMGEALKAGLARMQQIGGAGLGDRTMVDALHPALEALGDGLAAATRAARAGADHTATMRRAKAGRAAYISAGGLGMLILTGLDQGHTEKILVGAGLVALLALLLDQAIGLAQRRAAA
jgi:dihydroxyacetone kinase